LKGGSREGATVEERERKEGQKEARCTDGEREG
jgi:hypothetical protein